MLDVKMQQHWIYVCTCSLSAVCMGAQAALGAGMRCIITYTSSTKDQDFEGAERIMESLVADDATLAVLSRGGSVVDDRVAVVAPT
jgi:hypothetical protein